MQYGKILFPLLAVWLLSSCTTVHTGLADLYNKPEARRDQPPIVIVHGMFGSQLHSRTGRPIWAGDGTRATSWSQLAPKFDNHAMLDDGVQARALASRAAGIALDDALLDILERSGGYMPAQIGQPSPEGRRYYVFTYDWRRGAVHVARELDAFLAAIRADYGSDEQKVDLVAHGYGGLIVRYFLRYGTEDVLDGRPLEVTLAGARHARRVILLGVPNLGTLVALQMARDGLRIGRKQVPAETLALMPSFPQVFPHPLAGAFITADGEPYSLDLFDIEVWRQNQWAIFDPQARAHKSATREGARWLRQAEQALEKQLRRGERFVAALTAPTPTAPARYIVFGGVCIPTIAHSVVEREAGQLQLRWNYKQVRAPVTSDLEHLMMAPGDGTITKASLLGQAAGAGRASQQKTHFPLGYSFVLCEQHATISANYDFQNNLLHALLDQDDIQQ